MNPFFLAISDGRVYVVEDSVSVPYLRSGCLRASPSSRRSDAKGQGPGEFDYIYSGPPLQGPPGHPGLPQAGPLLAGRRLLRARWP
ncbi:MAG: hypothetical protein MZU91_10880 [Desulfosudis oleivorans]|nr:hypothetical protein [Desulfosudis oleivorans]